MMFRSIDRAVHSGTGTLLTHSCSQIGLVWFGLVGFSFNAMLMISISGGHFVINRAWALHHKLGQSELLTDPQLRHPDDSVEGQLWERKQGHADTKAKCSNTQTPRVLEITSSLPRRAGRNCNTFDHWRNGRNGSWPEPTAHYDSAISKRKAF